MRRTHHIRGGDILTLHQAKMGRFGYDDGVLIRTIADVCVAHGLQQNELNDPERFPERRIIRDELVNVRLLAIMLRLGDLLDMNSDRACPLLLNAASPIPADSMAHWSQYQCITHTMVGEDEIQLIAECQNEEEHRFLHDWCAWLVSELDQAQRLMVRSTRHTGWIPPVATIDHPSGGNTITIRPAKGAKYIPAQWRFELDTKAIFNRLIYDALDTPWDFLRELLQNAADATRCRMFAELLEREGSTPLYPTQVDERIRNAYPIRVTLSTIEVRNELSEEIEERHLLTVEDEGLGMDRDVIQKYLLQVGRSFYTTKGFRNTFGFIASSRFGIGFLSVFSASDDVTIETFKPSSTIEQVPLKLRLTGPRSYLLTEKGNRRRPGTSIQIVLRKMAEPGKVLEAIKGWCTALEFPIIVTDLGIKTEIQAERAEDFIMEAPVIGQEDAKLVVRAFPINREGIEGSLFVLAYVDSNGERWDKAEHLVDKYDEQPLNIGVEVPQQAIFFHGINTLPEKRDRRMHFGGEKIFSRRIDLRGERFNPSLTRSDMRFRFGMDTIPELKSRWDEILGEHLSSIDKSLNSCFYKQKISENIGSLEFWINETATIPILQDGNQLLLSLSDTDTIEIFTTLIPVVNPHSKHKQVAPSVNGISIPDEWLSKLTNKSAKYIFSKRHLKKLEVTDNWIICIWTKSSNAEQIRFRKSFFADFNPEFIGTSINNIAGYGRATVVNRLHPFGKWYEATQHACLHNQHSLNMGLFKKLEDKVYSTISYNRTNPHTLKNFLVEWNKLPKLPGELIAPVELIEANSFCDVPYSFNY